MATSVPAPPQGPPMSEPARILNTYIAPTKTFTDLQRNASWWGPYLLVVLVTLLFAFVVGRQIGFEQVARNQVARSARATEQMDKLPADQRAQQFAVRGGITKVFSYGIPVLALIGTLIIAAVLTPAFNIGAEAGVSFKTAFAIAMYGGLPWLIHALLGILSMLAGADKEAFNVENPVGTNPAFFMDPMGSKFLQGLMSSFDIFAIWSIVLTGIGFACNSRVKRGTAIAIVGGFYLVYKLAMAGLATLG